jgi:hypothetical protein
MKQIILIAFALCLMVTDSDASRRRIMMGKAVKGASGGGSPTFPAGATAYWQMNEATGTRVDFYTGNDLSESAAINSRAGFVGDAPDFDGNARYLQKTDTADISVGADVDFSIVFAFRTDTAPAFQYVFSKNDAGGGGEEFNFILLSGEGSAARFSLWNSGGSQQAFDTTAVFSSGVTYHIVITYDQSNIRIYVNGSLDSTHANTQDCRDTASPWTFGYDFENGGVFNGFIDEAGIWKRALSLAEAAALAAGAQP